MESEGESDGEQGKATGEAPMAEKRAKRQLKLRTPVILDGVVTFVGKKAGSWEVLKDRVLARRINRIKVG